MQINSDGEGSGFVIGVDLGGTKIEAVVLDSLSDEIYRIRIDTPDNYETMLQEIANLLFDIEERQGVRADSVGVGMPGSISLDTGLLRNCNLEYCNGENVHGDLERVLQRRIWLENDANCFAVSEAFGGAGENARIVLALTIGTGIGGALVVDKVLHRGPNGLAGEFGHLPLPWLQEDDYPLPNCHCGRVGCAEQYISGTGFERDYCKISGENITGEEIMLKVADCDAAAIQAYSRLVDRFARFLAGIYGSIDPDVIVVGGGMSNINGFVDRIRESVPCYMLSSTDRVKLVKARYGAASGVRGAALLGRVLRQKQPCS